MFLAALFLRFQTGKPSNVHQHNQYVYSGIYLQFILSVEYYTILKINKSQLCTIRWMIHKYNVKWKKSNMKEFKVCCSIYVNEVQKEAKLN